MSNGTDKLAEAITNALFSESIADLAGNDANVVDALASVAEALRMLGNADASTPMGALEAHGAAMIEASENVARGLHDIADAVREASGPAS